MWRISESNRDLNKAKSQTIPQTQAPRWRIWVSDLLSLTVYLLNSCKSMASCLTLPVHPSPVFMGVVWKFVVFFSSAAGVNLTAPRYVMIIPLYFSTSAIQDQLYGKVFKLQHNFPILSKLFQNYQVSNEPLLPFPLAGVLWNEVLNLLISGSRTLKKGKEKIDANDVLLSNQPQRLSQPVIKVHRYQFTVQSFPKITQNYEVYIPQCYPNMEKEEVDTNYGERGSGYK